MNRLKQQELAQPAVKIGWPEQRQLSLTTARKQKFAAFGTGETARFGTGNSAELGKASFVKLEAGRFVKLGAGLPLILEGRENILTRAVLRL